MITEVIKKNRESILAAGVCTLLGLGYAALAGISLFIPFLLLFYVLFLTFIRKAGLKRLLFLALLLVLMMFMASAMTEFSRFSIFYIPVSVAAMLVVLLFDDMPLAFSMSAVISAVITLLVGGGVDFLLVSFIGGLTGAFIVRDARTRGTILRAGVLVGVVQVAGYLLFHPGLDQGTYSQVLKPLFISGFAAAMFVLATLKIFEYLSGELTNFSLLELSDSLNQPLLKRMAFEAPGTYHHSLVMSNIASVAADAIGANQMLVRVGAYYHDIGKLVKPQYFTENQMMSDNKHDDLEPSMSRLVILNHVKEGVDFAHRHGLNQKIIDFITQHHGTSLIYYFYHKAVTTADKGEKVDELNYRYPGPKPQTRETAIVMLADAVEGATRTLDDHSPTRIGELVRKVVNNKFIDGQMDECPLTLRDINIISETFTRVLASMYHVRIKYPDAQKK